MSTEPTVPIFSPDGTLGDIPQSQLVAAVKAGAKPGVHIISPDGSPGVIPADRTQDAVRAGAKLVPLKDQPVQNAGFWHSLLSDVASIAHAIPDLSVTPAYIGAPRSTVSQMPEQLAAADQARQQEGRGPVYRAGAMAATGAGANVTGMEQSAREGDVAGVVGHAAAVPVVMAATAGAAKGSDLIANVTDHPAFQGAMSKVQQMAGSTRTAAATVARTGGALLNNDVAGVLSPRLKHVGGMLDRTAGVLEKKAPDSGAPIERDATLDRRNIPEFAGEQQTPTAAPKGVSIERDATLDQRNIPEFAGEEKPPLVDMQDRLAQAIAAKRDAPNFTAADRLKAKSLLRDALKSSTADVVDAAIPGKNAAVKAKVDFYLQKGDVASAEQALDQGAKAANPDYQPFFRDPRPVPTTNEIRTRIQADANAPKAGTRADLMEDKAVDQQWQWHLERHGWSAESEARREFIARNSTGMTKGELAKRFAESRSGSGAQTAPAQAAGPETAANDLTSILQKSLDAARKQKGQQ
jgi:hypothetical protein